METKISKTLDFIRAMLGKYRNPCILWSGGKDSMVLLHLIKFKLGINLPCVCWRDPWMPHKLKFIERVIQEWQLEVWDYAPSRISLCRGNGKIDALMGYQINSPLPGQEPQYIEIAKGTESPEEGKPYLCGLETFLSRPLGSFAFPWDGMFHGHKSADVDPLFGKVPLSVDFILNPSGAASLFPLREWTDDEIFQYHGDNYLPFDERRYDVKNKKTLDDKHANPDYYHACFKCCDPSSPKFVRCPKYDADVNNVAHLAPWISPSLAYCGITESK